MLLPMVEDCVRSVDLEARPYRCRARASRRLMQLDVFTLVPHAFAWLTEQRPVATVLGGELDLRLFSYRDTRRCAPARSTTSRTAAAPAWCCASTSSRPRSTPSTAARPRTACVALTPAGPAADAGGRRGARARASTLTLLSARFEGFDERIVEHLATDAISIGPYVLSNGDLPAMVLVDAIARRLPGALAEGSGELESFSDELGGGLEYPHYTRPAEFRGWRVPDVLLSGDHARDRGLAEGAGALRNPIDHLTEGLPHGWRVTIDWLVTIVGAIVIVLAIKAWVVNPYRIPSSSMEPTLHCARPGSDCEARFSDRVLACRFCYRFWSPKRGDIIVFNTPPLADVRCGAGGTFVKRLIGLPGETWEERSGYVYINGKRLDEPYIKPARRDDAHDRRRSRSRTGQYFMMGDNRSVVVRLARVGHRAAGEPDRQGVRDLLAAGPDLDSLTPRGARALRRAGVHRLAGRVAVTVVPRFALVSAVLPCSPGWWIGWARTRGPLTMRATA